MPAKTTPINKSQFIRSQPTTLSAAEVVAKAKAAGTTIRPGLVYEVRRAAKAKKRAARKTASMGTKKSTKPAQSKAAFVRAHASLSAQEVVATAKTQGVKLNTSYVYNVRGADRAARKKRASTKKATIATPAFTNGARPSGHSNAEALLKALGAELGLSRAMEVLSEERERVKTLIGG